MREFSSTIRTLDPPIPWSHWSHFGFFLGLDRIRGESNTEYRDRLLDVMIHRAGSTHFGLAHAINRELGLLYTDNAITIIHKTAPDGQPIVRDLTVAVRADAMVFLSETFLVEDEAHTIPSDTLEISLSRNIERHNLTAKDSSNNIVAPDDYVINPYRNTIRFKDTHAGTDLLISYNYHISVATNQTLANMVTEVTASITANAEQFVNATVASGYETKSGIGIPLFPPSDISGTHIAFDHEEYYDELRAPWGEAHTRSLNDPLFIESKLDVSRSMLRTCLMRYVEEARNIAHIEWSKTIFDFDRWATNMGLAEVPFLFDANVVHWTCENPQHTVEFTAEENNALEGVCPIDGSSLKRVGVPPSQMASGIGGDDDLKVIIEKENPAFDYTADTYDYITVTSIELEVPSYEQALINEGL